MLYRPGERRVGVRVPSVVPVQVADQDPGSRQPSIVPGSLQRGEEPLCFGECLHPRLRLGHLEQEQSLDRGVGRGHCVAGLVRERLGLLEGRLCGTEIAALLENRTERDQRASAFGVL